MAESIALTGKDGRGSPMLSAGRWEVQYARFFGYNNPASHASTLSVTPRNRFKSVWLSTCRASSAATVSLLNNASSSSNPILTVTFQGRTLEEHFVRKLHFSWSQLLCGRGSHSVFVSYEDEQNETQKFGLRFSTYDEADAFVAYLEDILSGKQEPADARTSVQYKPESLNQNRCSELSNVITSADSSEVLETNPITSEAPETWHPQIEHHQPYFINDMPQFDYDGYAPTMPPRFTTLVSNCASAAVQGQGAPAIPITSEGFDLKSQIAKYMQDASFLDILTKVEEVISELGGDSTTLHRLL